MNSTAAIHDTTSAMVTTWNSERVYSPVLEAAVAIGRNPAAVVFASDRAVPVYAVTAHLIGKCRRSEVFGLDSPFFFQRLHDFLAAHFPHPASRSHFRLPTISSISSFM